MHDPRAFQSEIEECAKKFNVSPAVHQDDFIFQFLMDNPVFHDKYAAIEYYFSDGQQSAKTFDELVGKFLAPRPSPIRVLEFASGFGCVSRHFRKFSPAKYSVVCSDIHPRALRFISDEIGLTTVPSHEVPESLSISSKFDVVFALSFFSHMPDQSWGRWLLKLVSLVADGGLLIFTTHGRQSSIKYMGNPPVGEDGYWFAPRSEQNDLSVEQYGLTVTAPRYVFAHLRPAPQANPVFFQESFWWGHQDCYIVSPQSWLKATP
jgi:SAM-dependent methyltransferase